MVNWCDDGFSLHIVRNTQIYIFDKAMISLLEFNNNILQSCHIIQIRNLNSQKGKAIHANLQIIIKTCMYGKSLLLRYADYLPFRQQLKLQQTRVAKLSKSYMAYIISLYLIYLVKRKLWFI